MSDVYPETPLSSPPATVTPAQAAYEASVAVMAGDFEHPPWRWSQLPQKHRQGWDAAAQAAARPALAECARLIAELSACRQNNAAIAVQLDQYRDERDEAREQLAEARNALILARTAAREMSDEFATWTVTPEDQERITAWRQRAGLEAGGGQHG